MREILFRGQWAHNNQWVEGFYVVDYTENHSAYIVNSQGRFLIVHKSVGLYTGLKDKNGTRIFEGDIFINPSDPRHKYVVCWEDGGFPWFCHEGSGFDAEEIEIIGNIHDNPEFLKE